MGSQEEEGYKGYYVISLPSKTRGEKEVSSGLLEDVATYFIVFAHSCMEKMASLPFPVGTIIEAVEELTVPLAHPIEEFTLRFLAAVDDQIYVVCTSIEGYVLCLRTRGLIGMSADLWVQHEASVREKMQTIINLANKIPLIGLITPFVCTLSAPLGNAVSDWLVEHSQSQVKRIQFHDKETEKREEGLDELKEKPRDWQTHTSEIVEAKDVKEEEIKLTDVTLKKDVAGGETRKGVPELEVEKVTDDAKENNAKDVSAVLELIDSGWLLGSPAGAASPKASGSPKASATAVPRMSDVAASKMSPKTAGTAAPKTSSNPKKQANSKSRRGALRH